MVRPTTLYRSTGALNITDKNSSPDHRKDFSQFKNSFSFTEKDSQSASSSNEVLTVAEKLNQLKDLLNMVYIIYPTHLFTIAIS